MYYKATSLILIMKDFYLADSDIFGFLKLCSSQKFCTLRHNFTKQGEVLIWVSLSLLLFQPKSSILRLCADLGI
jgi:hypothetical protein